MKYRDIILTIIAVTLMWGVIELVRTHDSIMYDYRPEKNIHFNRSYDVSMFKGSSLDIEETESNEPFMDIYKGEENETENCEKSTVTE